MTEHLIVYGTLMRGFNNRHAKALARSATFVGPAVFQAKLFLIGPYPAAVPSNTSRHQVHGEVFQLDRPEILSELDHFEECGENFPEPTEYRRVKHRVHQPSGADLMAWIYNRATDGLKILEHGRFSVLS